MPFEGVCYFTEQEHCAAEDSHDNNIQLYVECYLCTEDFNVGLVSAEQYVLHLEFLPHHQRIIAFESVISGGDGARGLFDNILSHGFRSFRRICSQNLLTESVHLLYQNSF